MNRPRAHANRITQILQSVLGDDAYPVNVEKIVAELCPQLVPNVAVKFSKQDLDSVEGALLKSTDGKKWLIVVSNAVASVGRQNFTAAHELGHFLCHRELRSEFRCGSSEIDKLVTYGEVDLETEANQFASQLLLPPNMVRPYADAAIMTFDVVAELAEKMGSSIQAAASACVDISSKPIAVVVVREGIIKWGRASRAAYKAGIFFRSSQDVPIASRFSSEFGQDHIPFDALELNNVWAPGAQIESGYYSGRYGEACVMVHFKH